MFLQLLLLVLCPLVADPAELVVVAVPGGVEARIGDYTLTGSRVVFDQKNRRVVVDGGGALATVEYAVAGRKTTTQANRITLDLPTGKIVARTR